MKYRILRNQDGLFAVQIKVWYWPFWIFDKGFNEGGGSVIHVWGSRGNAVDRAERLMKACKKDRWEKT